MFLAAVAAAAALTTFAAQPVTLSLEPQAVPAVAVVGCAPTQVTEVTAVPAQAVFLEAVAGLPSKQLPALVAKQVVVAVVVKTTTTPVTVATGS